MAAFCGKRWALGISALALAAGCATQPQGTRVATYGAPASSGHSHYTGPDRLFRNGYVNNTRPGSQDDVQFADARVFAAYEGIGGARLAHQIFNAAQAEKLDGACERFVKVAKNETLYDVAEYCDVPVATLIDYNPVIRNPRHVAAGQIIEVPHSFNAERHALASGAPGIMAASWYVVQPGDTLQDIAARHLVSTSSVANINPEVNWRYLQVGAQVRIPAPIESHSYEAASSGIANSTLPYPYAGAGSSSGGQGFAVDPTVTAVMPYVMTPAQKAAEEAVAKAPLLTVNQRVVNPGGTVNVSAVGLPANAPVSLYSGPNGRDLRFVRTVRTDASGAFSEPVTVSSGDVGGVIFRATVDDSGDQLQSPRVNIDRIVAPEEE